MSLPPLTEAGLLDKISRHEKLDLREERAVIYLGSTGPIADVEKVVEGLRASSSYYQNKSVEELEGALGDFRKMKVIEATLGIDKMFDTQLEAAQRVAQANRIENETARCAASMSAPLPKQGFDLKNVLPQDTKHKHFDSSGFAMPKSGWC